MTSALRASCTMCAFGHRAQNCPNAHIVQEARKAEVTGRLKRGGHPEPPKPKRKLSPERKAQLIATLAKARAAKKGKS